MSKKKKKQTPHSEARLPFYIPPTSGEMLEAFQKALVKVAHGKGASGETATLPKALQEFLGECQVGQSASGSSESMLLGYLAEALCCAYETCYGQCPAITAADISEGKRAVADCLLALVKQPPNTLGMAVLVKANDWLSKGMLSDQCDVRALLGKVLTLWLAFELAAKHTPQLLKHPSPADTTRQGEAKPERKPAALSERDAHRVNNVRRPIKHWARRMPGVTKRSPQLEVMERIHFHGGPTFMAEADLRVRGLRVDGGSICISGEDDFPFIELCQLTNVGTGQDSGKCFAYYYQYSQGLLVHRPFGAFVDLLGGYQGPMRAQA